MRRSHRHRRRRGCLPALVVAALGVVGADHYAPVAQRPAAWGAGAAAAAAFVTPPRSRPGHQIGCGADEKQLCDGRRCRKRGRHHGMCIFQSDGASSDMLADHQETDTHTACAEGINLGELTEADRQQLLWRLLVDANLLNGEKSLQSSSSESADDILLFDNGYDSETLGRGFCNWVYKVTPAASPSTPSSHIDAVVVKIFSDLAKVRVPEPVLGSIDVLASDAGIGPTVMHRGRNGVVMEHIDGQVLTEEDVHGSDGRILCEKIGIKLAQLHATSLPSNLLAEVVTVEEEGNNMLWRTLDAMLDFVGNDEPIPRAVLDAGWTHARLYDEVRSMRQTLHMLDLSPAVLGHGDFKPSNIMVVDNDPNLSSKAETESAVVLIDYELSGRGYRGFDFYKLFRTADPATQNQDTMVAFIRSYLQHLSDTTVKSEESSSTTIDPAQIEQVLAEMKLFEPLTWLEAGIFFLFAAKGDPTQLDRWEELALNRLDNYSASKARFAANLVEWESIKQHKAKETLR